jgi:hypothetical protein
MKKARLLVVMVVVAAFMVAVLAPAAFAAVNMKLTGPNNADNGQWVALHLTIKNPGDLDGLRVSLCMKSRNGGLHRIVSKQISWNWSQSVGTCTFFVRATPSAMGIGIYRAAWRHVTVHEGHFWMTSYSNHKSVAIN